MKVHEKNPPRVFEVGFGEIIRMKDCAEVELAPDEQITLTTEAGAEYDLARKSWGFYATPSLNSRLQTFRLRGVLVRNRLDRYFVLLVESGCEDDFQRYLDIEGLALVCWMDSTEALKKLERGSAVLMPDPTSQAPLQCPCEGRYLSRAFLYETPPEGEVRFTFNTGNDYRREVLRCGLCNHFISRHSMDTSSLYSEEYVNATYGGNGIERNFQRIIGLDPAKSDNVGRVDRVVAFAKAHFGLDHTPSILDVGSGLCVFLHRVKQVANWDATALDPDERAAAHARDVVGVKAICTDFLIEDNLGSYDVITFNKVLEHVEDPVAMLARSLSFLNPGGFVYIELPDGECAVEDGAGREEFFIEHHHIFSAASIVMLAKRAGYTLQLLERLQEPSTKYTLRAFLTRSS